MFSGMQTDKNFDPAKMAKFLETFDPEMLRPLLRNLVLPLLRANLEQQGKVVHLEKVVQLCQIITEELNNDSTSNQS